MLRGRTWTLAASLIAVLLAPACRADASAESESVEPYTVEPVEGADVSRVTLTEDAARRIGLVTTPVEEVGGHLRIPASALWIDVRGTEWVYATDGPLAFVRAEVVVARYRGDTAVLSRGPAGGTEVVTVGVAELIGSEFGI